MLRVASTSFVAQRNIAHLVRSVTVQAHVEAYTKLRQLQPSLYRSAPENGQVELTVDYLDTWHHRSESPSKVIVAVHGCPDNYNTFKTLAENFEHSDVRMVIPNLPDISHTRKTGFFWHSPEEKCSFMRAFLSTLNIDRIDCLVCHSLGMLPTSELWAQPGQIDIGSVALFAPFPQWYFKVTPTVIAFGTLVNAFPRSELYPRIISKLGVEKHTIVPMRVSGVEKYQLLTATVVFPRHRVTEISELNFQKLLSSDRPVTVVYGTQEKLVHPKAIKKMYRMMDLTEQQVIRIDAHTDQLKNIPLPSQVNSQCTSYLVNQAGHVVHTKWPQFSHALLSDMVRLAK